MAEIVLFHHIQGLTRGVLAFADELRAAGHTVHTPDVFVASLDHAVWFHRPFRADEWWLYDQVSPSASNGRALVLARVFTQDGQLVASVAQEAVMRPRKEAR